MVGFDAVGVGFKVFVVPVPVYQADATASKRTRFLLLFITHSHVFMRRPVIPIPSLGTQASGAHDAGMPPGLEVFPPLERVSVVRVFDERARGVVLARMAKCDGVEMVATQQRAVQSPGAFRTTYGAWLVAAAAANLKNGGR